LEEKKYKVLIADNIAKEALDVFKKYNKIIVEVNTKLSPEKLIKVIGQYDGIIVRSKTKLRKEVIQAAINLKVIVRAGTGYDNIDVEECTKRGIAVLITPLGNANAVVELTMGMMLNAARMIVQATSTMAQGKWEKKKFLGTELKGKTVGIIGLGRIGSGVAKRCKAFEMNVVAYDKFIPKRIAEDLGVQLFDNLDDLIKISDYITIHLPLTPQTKDLINSTHFEKMKPNAVIINVARGGVVNEKALYNALKEKKIAGACIDVYSKEPASPNEFPFIGLDNCITTPHIGANTVEAQKNVAILAAENMAQALLSNIFIDAVNIPFKIPADKADLYRPYMALGSNLGKILGQYNSHRIKKVTIKYKGELFVKYFEPIKAVILQSLFENRLKEEITFINTEEVLKDNGIEIELSKYEKSINFENYIKVYIETDNDIESKIAGTVFIDTPKIVEIDGLYFDFAPTDIMLIIKNYDKPGVVGRIGTFLGEHNINIASLQLGRKEKGTEAISVISIDEKINGNILQKLKYLKDIIDVSLIVL